MARRGNAKDTQRDSRIMAAALPDRIRVNDECLTEEDRHVWQMRRRAANAAKRPLTEALSIVGQGDGTVRGAAIDALALRAKAGDKEALAELVPAVSLLIAHLVERFIRSVTNNEGLRRHTEDLFQDAFAAAFDACRRFDGESASYVSYAYQCAFQRLKVHAWPYITEAGIHTAHYVHYMDPEKRAALELPAYSAAESEDRVTAQPPHVEAEKREETSLVRERVDRLPHKQRRVLTLRYGIGGAQPKSLHEVSGIMGIDRVAVRKIEAQALRELGAGR